MHFLLAPFLYAFLLTYWFKKLFTAFKADIVDPRIVSQWNRGAFTSSLYKIETIIIMDELYFDVSALKKFKIYVKESMIIPELHRLLQSFGSFQTNLMTNHHRLAHPSCSTHFPITRHINIQMIIQITMIYNQHKYYYIAATKLDVGCP